MNIAKNYVNELQLWQELLGVYHCACDVWNNPNDTTGIIRTIVYVNDIGILWQKCCITIMLKHAQAVDKKDIQSENLVNVIFAINIW